MQAYHETPKHFTTTRVECNKKTKRRDRAATRHVLLSSYICCNGTKIAKIETVHNACTCIQTTNGSKRVEWSHVRPIRVHGRVRACTHAKQSTSHVWYAIEYGRRDVASFPSTFLSFGIEASFTHLAILNAHDFTWLLSSCFFITLDAKRCTWRASTYIVDEFFLDDGVDDVHVQPLVCETATLDATTMATCEAASATNGGGAEGSTSTSMAMAMAKAKDGKHSKRFLYGLISGSIASGVLQPLDVVRTRMQSGHVCTGTWNTVMEIGKERGWRGFWSGTTPSIVRVGMGVGLYFVVLEHLQDLFAKQQPNTGNRQLTSTQTLLIGGAARASVAMLLCPVTVVKTRMEQTGPGVVGEGNMFRALGSIAKMEGVSGLFRGLGPTVVANAPFSALYYLFYTRTKDYLEYKWGKGAAANFVSGLSAAAVATTITQPADILRTRLQLYRSTPADITGILDKRTPSGMLTIMLREEGPGVFTRGLLPRVLKRSLQTAVVWTIYEALSYTTN